MTLYEQINDAWITGKCEATVSNWAQSLNACLETVGEARTSFHEWEPLKVYLSYSMATLRKPIFSLRYLGQEVGKILPKDEISNTRLQVKIDHERTTKKAFGIKFEHRTRDWNSPEGREFRKAFKAPKRKDPHSQEHWIESRFLEEMKTNDATKFGGTFRNIQPVLLTGCPFQCPVPIGASDGLPKNSTRANIDILAREAGRKLAIWELKRPGITAHCLDQVYIYAVTLAKMLRAEGGDTWYRLFGFTGKIPDLLELNAVVAVTPDQQQALKNRLHKFESPLELSSERTKIRLFAAYYDWDQNTEELKINSRVPLVPNFDSKH